MSDSDIAPSAGCRPLRAVLKSLTVAAIPLEEQQWAGALRPFVERIWGGLHVSLERKASGREGRGHFPGI